MVDFTPYVEIETRGDFACEFDRQYLVKVVEYTEGTLGHRLVSLLLIYPRMIHQEFLTHRVLSRNAASSRAIPAKTARRKLFAFAEPAEWGANNPGMQSRQNLSPFRTFLARSVWRFSGTVSLFNHFLLERIGAHKQITNRIIEPYSLIHVVATATIEGWESYLKLRTHEDADPTIRRLSEMIEITIDNSTPRMIADGEWHIPLASGFARSGERDETELLVESVENCARVSYTNIVRKERKTRERGRLFVDLATSEPPHMSPFEHQAQYMTSFRKDDVLGNFGHPWVQLRHHPKFHEILDDVKKLNEVSFGR